MVRSLYESGLFRRYLDKKKRQLADIQRTLEDLPLDHVSRPRLLECMLYLQKGIPQLEIGYREPTSPLSSGGFGSDAVGADLPTLRSGVEDTIADAFSAMREIKKRGISEGKERRPAAAQGEAGRDLQSASVGATTTWDRIEIWFLSDERVRIHKDGQVETHNYDELGFGDQRNGKPNRAWELLRTLAGSHGIIREAKTAGQPWPKVEKRIQEIRKVLRTHFGIRTDPIPFVTGIGYRACFKIGCRPSFDS